MQEIDDTSLACHTHTNLHTAHLTHSTPRTPVQGSARGSRNERRSRDFVPSVQGIDENAHALPVSAHTPVPTPYTRVTPSSSQKSGRSGLGGVSNGDSVGDVKDTRRSNRRDIGRDKGRDVRREEKDDTLPSQNDLPSIGGDTRKGSQDRNITSPITSAQTKSVTNAQTKSASKDPLPLIVTDRTSYNSPNKRSASLPMYNSTSLPGKDYIPGKGKNYKIDGEGGREPAEDRQSHYFKSSSGYNTPYNTLITPLQHPYNTLITHPTTHPYNTLITPYNTL